MQDESILENLEKLFAELSIELRYEKGRFQGGYYRYKDRQQIVVNKDLTDSQKVAILARELHENLDLDSVYVVPAVREVIENAGRLEQ